MFCSEFFIDYRGNKNYCSRDCYEYAKNDRSRSNYETQKALLRESKIQQNNLICEKLFSEQSHIYYSSFEELDELGFDFSYFKDVTKDEFGYAHTLTSFQLRLIDPFKLEIQRL
jgi:hypothetical protein